MSDILSIWQHVQSGLWSIWRKQKKRSFSPGNKREELLISIWLHDIGKVITPLKVMDKEKRLLPEQKVAFSNRMGRIALALGKSIF